MTTKTKSEPRQTLADFAEYRASEAKVSELREHLQACRLELHAGEQRGENIDEEAVALASGQPAGPTVAELRRKTAVAERALQLAESDFFGVTIQCGSILCQENLPEHKELMQRIELAVAELVDALREENNFVSRFHFAGTPASFSRPALKNHGDLLARFCTVQESEFTKY